MIYEVPACLVVRGVFSGREGVWFHVCLYERVMFSRPAERAPFPVIERARVCVSPSECDKSDGEWPCSQVTYLSPGCSPCCLSSS